MKIKLLILLIVILALQSLCYAHENQFADWIRVQSDSGEFSIEIPSKFNFFFNAEGAMAPQQGGGLYLKNMHLLNAYTDKTLVSFEFYEEREETLDRFYEDSKIVWKDIESTIDTSEIKGKGFSIRQVIRKNKDFYLVQQYFHSKKYIYILTAASRDGETKTMRRFLDSLLFKPNTKEAIDSQIPVLSSLKVSSVDVVTKNVLPATPDEMAQLMKSTPGSTFILVSKPRPSYTDAARQKQVQGKIQMRVSFSEGGFTPRIELINSLPEGLFRQALFAAIKIKFLPEEKNGKPENVNKVVEYSFQIY